MRVARSLEETAEFEPVAVTIGNFDGVHTGHHELLQEVLRAAEAKGLQAAVLTFDPHPASIVAPQRAARLLTTQAERCSVLAREGISELQEGQRIHMKVVPGAKGLEATSVELKHEA